jgi:hypothetical protein
VTIAIQAKNIRRDRRAITPAISTIIVTSAVIVMVLVAMFFANSYLQSTLSQSEYKANRQFMTTEGLQIDDVAWTIGRTQTSIFTSKYGTVNFEPNVLTYTFEVKTTGSWQLIGNYTSGVAMYTIPTSLVSLGNGYFERIYPTNGSFLEEGATAPVSQIFVSQKNSLVHGSGLRIVAEPTIRMLNSTIIIGAQQQNYFKFYLPILAAGTNLYASQSITQTSKGVLKIAVPGVTLIRVNASVTPAAQALGYDIGDLSSSSFFRFQSLSVTYPSTGSLSSSTIELYIANVTVSIGLAS